MSRSEPVDAERDDDADRAELEARIEFLSEENRRLRAAYARARGSRHRRTAAGLALLGVLAATGAYAFPDGRDVLLALAATGLFGGVLTYYLAPERFLAATVGERLVEVAGANAAAIAEALDLGGDPVYVPAAGATLARLYVPRRDRAGLPSLSGPFVVDGDHRGLALEPVGAALLREGADDELSGSPTAVAERLLEWLLEGLELVGSVELDVDEADGRCTVAVGESALGPLDRFDHPVPSVLATGLAVGLDRPVRATVEAGDGPADWLVTCRWDVEAEDGD